MKRALDFCIALALLVVLSPVLLLCALVVWITIGWPVLFVQVRPGLGGRPFRMVKFRTMSNRRDVNGNLLPDHERLGPFGAKLRATSLDELPELWNVLRGDMSLVGPRPLLMQYLPRYSPRQSRRHEVRPGITGYAQVNGRNALSWEDRLELDVWYVENRSLWLDATIIVRTVFKVAHADGVAAPGQATMTEFMGEGAVEPKARTVTTPGGVQYMAAVSRKLPGWPVFADDEVSAAESVLRSGKVNYWTGQEGKTFEREFAARFGRRHGIALANGTLALELALKAYGVGPGDDVVVTPRSFIASASCVITVGATPVFADVDRDSQNLTAASIEAALTPRTRAVIVVHLAGWPCDMPAIMALAQRRGLIVIEDCAQSPGAMVAGKPAGSFGHAAAFSFCQDKIITTAGEGGMLLLDDEERWSWSWSYKDHGKSFAKMAAPPAGAGFRFVHDAIGTNWRLSEVQSAVGRRQLAKLDEWVEIRREHACELQGLLGGLAALRLPQPSADLRHAYYKFYGFVAPEALAAGWTRDRLLAELTGAGVPCFTGSCGEIYREEGMVAAGYGRAERLPVARELGETSLMWLVHPTLSAEDVRHVGEVSARIIAAASR